MGKYLAPGVYVEEVPSGARPIQAVSTSTAGFVGIAPIRSAHPHEAVGTSNWTQFLREFASNGGDHVGNPLAQAVYGFFLNGGSRCYVVNCQSEDQLSGSHQGLNVLETVDEVAIVAAPGMTGASAYDAVLSHCELMEIRFFPGEGIRVWGARTLAPAAGEWPDGWTTPTSPCATE
ncbi:hypothetical protein [Ectothiorhodospira shaposhnikovii]|uniref:hypothetical protein n=1 Tax=Ectothiorhodospira shaposhnikovii TaxID=1054 RepID=UPI001EE838E6|nr:hypothetical protein [Ectothiorhodospira shaposhnikovii]MCG5514137.1 hypothetical protein [Ectothiorhodospira shaposhnikovii]